MSIERLTEVSQELAAAKKKLQDFAQAQGKEAVSLAFADCFKEPSKIRKIRWTQYTPYFNDGDACEFSAHDPELFLADDSEEDENADDYSGEDTYGLTKRDRSYCNPDSDYNKERRAELEAKFGAEAVAAFLAVWEQLNDEILEAVFGDHVEVIVTKNGVTVEECSHD